ncbi:gliding motility lipoprotein GldD [Luteibaculum oceani]|uniref:Gliding motility lipoprotein GldD n=1 Tax=Luteibaculum oceani TaxID=1294296 RepID=A0A5C6V8R9_9FLAO|nr:gliding motility lipoprotein GldD [Luteibaculum oceani]TXC81812.1 gliding motility lipoprotein GldD [Luteibaculum oceani]
MTTKTNRLCQLGVGLFLSIIFIGCGGNPTPKPRGFIRIDFPEKQYKVTSLPCPYQFEIPAYSGFKKLDRECDYVLWFPRFKAEVYLNYRPINAENPLQGYLDEMHKLAYQHQVKASAINAKTREFSEESKFVLEYEIEGNVASSYQFCVTDSTSHFLRGALFFRSRPNQDSLRPATNFIKQDIDHIIKTLEWKP